MFIYNINMKELENISELSELIELVNLDENKELKRAVRHLYHNDGDPVKKGAMLFKSYHPFGKYDKKTRLKAAYYILFEDEITSDNLAYGCDNINDFLRKSFSFTYNNEKRIQG